MKSPFRSMRLTLFNEGKLLRYLGYAIGEIALIIIGILFALKINDWNEDRKAQVEFDEYVVQLREDVRKAISNANRTSSNMREQVAKGRAILSYLDQKDDHSVSLSEFENALNKITQYSVPQVKVGLLGQLIEGDLEPIGHGRDPMN